MGKCTEPKLSLMVLVFPPVPMTTIPLRPKRNTENGCNNNFTPHALVVVVVVVVVAVVAVVLHPLSCTYLHAFKFFLPPFSFPHFP